MRVAAPPLSSCASGYAGCRMEALEGGAPCSLSTRQELVGSRTVLRGRPAFLQWPCPSSQDLTLQISQSSCRQSQNERGRHSNWPMSLRLYLPHHPTAHLNTPRAENETSKADSPPVDKASRQQYLKTRFQAPRLHPHTLLPQHLARLRFHRIHTQHLAQAGRVTRRSKSFLLQKMSRYQPPLVRGDSSWPRPTHRLRWHRLRWEDQGPLRESPDPRPRLGQ